METSDVACNDSHFVVEDRGAFFSVLEKVTLAGHFISLDAEIGIFTTAPKAIEAILRLVAGREAGKPGQPGPPAEATGEEDLPHYCAHPRDCTEIFLGNCVGCPHTHAYDDDARLEQLSDFDLFRRWGGEQR